MGIRVKQVKCLYCGKEVDRKPKIYCSNKCQRAYYSKLTVEHIEQTNQVYNPQQARKYMIAKYGKVCSICKITSWQGQELPVIVDHINGNPEDNSLDNLRLVCPNCDAQLPTYKAKNKGNGRFARRERYKLGKSC